MNLKLRELPVEERIKLVEELWDSIASDQKALPLTDEQKAQLNRRLRGRWKPWSLGKRIDF